MTSRRTTLLAGVGLAAAAFAKKSPVAEEKASSLGDAVIRGGTLGGEIVVTTTKRLAGAIHSLTWNGQEFIDSADHGRQLQSASNLDCGTQIQAETFNPTEAGSRDDGAGATSTSRLLHLVAKDNQLQTTSQMAFWLAPGQKSGGHLAKNTARLSNHLLTKRVTVGLEWLPHVVLYDATFALPIGEHHTQAVFEVVTGYMPPAFCDFWKFDPLTNRLAPLDDGPGEQGDPVILATKSGDHAMGIYTPDRRRGMRGPGYGRFRFKAERVVKWNCVFRLLDEDGIRAADYSFRAFIPVGNLEMVRAALEELHLEFAPRKE